MRGAQESVARAETGNYADSSDGSLTRTDAQFRAIFDHAGLCLLHARAQGQLPAHVFAVQMYALRPGRSTIQEDGVLDAAD